MARRRKPADALAAASANPPQHIPTGPLRADFATMMPGYPKRHDGWNEQRVQRFLDTLAHTGCVQDAARVAGMSANAARRAQKRYILFAAAWDDALARAQQGLIAIAYRRAVEGRETIIIRKGEEYERRIEPSDAMLGMLIKRGDLTGAGIAEYDADALSYVEWQQGVRFDARGRKYQLPDRAEMERVLAQKMAALRERITAYARAHRCCPTCEQPLPERAYNHSVAQLVALGVVKLDELPDREGG